jgi:hypothetical protein
MVLYNHTIYGILLGTVAGALKFKHGCIFVLALSCTVGK